MAKIRGIKPDFWTDDDIVELSAHARLLYIGLWNFACDNGHVEDRPRQIKMRILPADDVDVDALLDELTTGTRITRSEGWVTIPNLGEHQRIDKRYFTTCPKPGCARPDDATPRNAAKNKPSHDGHTTGSRRAPNVSTPRPRVDGDGDGDGESDRTRKRATSLPKNWQPTPEHIARAREDGTDLAREVLKFKAWADEGQTSKNWNSRFTRWLMNAAEYQQARHGGRPSEGRRPGEALWDLPATGTGQ